jgi:hypothetical protein
MRWHGSILGREDNKRSHELILSDLDLPTRASPVLSTSPVSQLQLNCVEEHVVLWRTNAADQNCGSEDKYGSTFKHSYAMF